MEHTDDGLSPVMLYDGKCMFCHSVVQLVLKFESKPILRFAGLQSKGGQKLLMESGLEIINTNDVEVLGSFVIVERKSNQAFTKWKATQLLFRYLGGIWYYFGMVVGAILPTFIGNFFYSLGWRYRYLVLGKKDMCIVPSMQQKMRTIPDGDVY
jgi:predicted DCC family thiol-disulfide oxidoreductase YuxK